MKVIGLLISTFILLYIPPLLPFSSLHILALIAWCHILTHRTIYSKFFYLNIVKIALYLIFVMLYIFIVMLVNGQQAIVALGEVYSRLGAFIFEMVPVACYIVYKAWRKHIDILDLIIFAATLQGIISVFSFLFPNIQNYIVSTMVENGYSDVYLNLKSYRLYGVSYSMLFGMPIANSIIAVLAFYLSFSKGLKYLICSLLILFSAIINARITFVVLIIFSIFILYELLKPNGEKKTVLIARFIIFSIIIFVLGYLLYYFVSKNNDRIITGWISGIQNTVALIFNIDNRSSYFSYYRGSDRWQLPERFISIVLGTGQRVIRGNLDYNSDIGYINDIWLGGLLYSVLIYLFVIKEFLHLGVWFKCRTRLRLIGFVFLLIFAITNIKGTVVGINEVMALFSILFVSSYIKINEVATNI